MDIARFDQHQAEVLDQRKLVHEEFRSAIPKGDSRNVRTVLGSFGFPGDAADRLVGACSGGEQTRLALAKVMATPVNLLVLDEPTNHLDLPSCDLLEDALTAYPGTVLLVTHDRHLIRNVADAMIEVRDGRVRWHDRVDEALLGGAQPAPAPKPTAPQPPATPGRAKPDRKRREADQRTARPHNTRELRKELNKVEKAWERAEARVVELQEQMAAPEVYEDAERIRALVAEHDSAKDEAADLMTRWETLSVEIEAAGG